MLMIPWNRSPQSGRGARQRANPERCPVVLSREVPLPLRPSAHRRLAKEHGYGKGYRYPHDFEGADVEQQYLPDQLAGRVYYEPSDEGLEKQIAERLQRLRRLRLEARRR
jgi:putative ATPase